MSALTFTSAYRSLRPAEKQFVDDYVARVEREAHQRHERITLALNRPVPADIVERSGGMLDMPMVRAAIVERITQIAQDSELSAPRVIKELMSVGFASLGDYMEVGENGQPYFDMTKCTPEQLAAVKSVKIDESMRGRKFEFTLHSKLEALKMLGQYMGLLDPDNPHYREAQQVERQATALPATVTVEQAADEYARMING